MSNISVKIPGINQYFVNQIAVGHFVNDSLFDVYIAKIDYRDYGANAVAPMILSFMPNGQFVENTTKLFQNAIPQVFFTRVVAAIDLNEDGYDDVYVDDHGKDSNPFPGAQNLVFLSDGKGFLNSSLYGIPIYANGLNHGFGYGDITGTGSISVLNNGFRYGYQPAVELLTNNGSGFTNSPQKLPAFLNLTGPTGSAYTYGWSSMAELNGDGRADLLFGQWKESKDSSFALLNNGTGDFSQSSPMRLPKPAAEIKVPMVAQLTPIDLFHRGINDLVLSVTDEDGPFQDGGAYSVKYLQFLKNDGQGNFTDITNEVFPQEVIHGQTDWYIFLKSVDLNCDGFDDLLVNTTKSESFALINDQHGHLQKGPVYGQSVSVDICYPDNSGIPHVISTTMENILWRFVDGGLSAPVANGLTIYENSLSLGSYRYFKGSITQPDIYGTQWHDIFSPGFGKESFNGAGGIDELHLDGKKDDYQIAIGGIDTKIAHQHNADINVTLTNVERLQFSDKNIALDLAPTQAAGQTALLLGAVLPGQLAFDASKQALIGSVISLFDQGFTLGQLSGALLRLPVWDVLTGKAAPTTADIATYLVHNVYSGTETTAITNAAISAMNAETPSTQGNYLASLAASAANQTHINLVGVQASGLEYLG